MPDPPTQTAPSPAEVAAHLEALNLAGLGFATRRLLGKDAGRVTGQFAMWARQDLPALPSLTEPFWAALEPLGSGRPRTAAAAMCDQVLRARAGDPAVAGRAAADCAAASKTQYAQAPLHEAPDDTSLEARQRKALVKAVKDYWRAVGHVYGEVRARVITGEQDRAARMVRRADATLGQLVRRIATAAAAVAAQGTTDTEAAPTPAVHPRPEPDPAARRELPEPERVRSPLGDATQVDARAEAFARSQRVRADVEDDPEPRPVEVLSTKPVPNRIFAPIVFVLCVAGLALFVIFQVLNAPNPLTQ